MTSINSLKEQRKTQPALTKNMHNLMDKLRKIVRNPEVVNAYKQAICNVDDHVELSDKNPWKEQKIDFFVEYFHNWFTYLPRPNEGLGKIIPFTYFYLNNDKAYYFLNQFKSQPDSNTEPRTEIFNWIKAFVVERGNFMDSEESALYVDEWVDYLGDDINDFIIPDGGFKTFNQFFTRQLKPQSNSRPVSAPNDDSIVVAPADSVINFIISDLTLTQKLNVKSRQLNVTELLNGSKFSPYFEGGTAVSCVLLPQNYHHYHAPVTGSIVEGVEVPGIYFGMTDGDTFLNDLNFGQGNAEFSLFEDFHRAYYIIETEDYGHVGVVPVGLNTISSINPTLVCKTMVRPGGKPVAVEKGQELGHFAYGGSLNILLFEANVLPALSVLMGNRIGTMNRKKIVTATHSTKEQTDSISPGPATPA